MEWWQSFFDSTYMQHWSHLHPPEDCAAEAKALLSLLGLSAGDRVLDAPCGYGRISLPLAKLGMHVVGIDFSQDLISAAQTSCEEAGLSIQYQCADLRDVNLEGGMHAAINLFSSIGYGTEEDDLRVFRKTADALVPGGKFFLDTMHRDAVVSRQAVGQTTGVRGPNGLTLREKNTFDPIEGKVHSTWTWNSLKLAGSKRSVIRLYSVTELIALLTLAGFSDIQAFCGSNNQPFGASTLQERVGLLCIKRV